MARKLFDIIGEIFDVDPSILNDHTNQGDIQKWDSLNLVFLIDQLEKEYNINFSIDDVIEIGSILDIKNILKSRGISEEQFT